MAKRKCPTCGEPLKVRIKRTRVVPDRPAIARPDWHCASCGWSSLTSGEPPPPAR